MSHSTRGGCADEALGLVVSDISSRNGEDLFGAVKHLLHSFTLDHIRRQREPFADISYSFLNLLLSYLSMAQNEETHTPFTFKLTHSLRPG